MATLQKIRSKGPLLIIVIGLALFAFIAGDAWKMLKPDQGSPVAGIIDGKKISVVDYQDAVQRYTRIVEFVNNGVSLSEEAHNSIQDEVWQTMVRKALVEKEASAAGIQVTDAEMMSVIEAGNDPMLSQTPFVDQNGKFDADNLRLFLSSYNELDRSEMPAEYLNYYDNLYIFWEYIEENIRLNLLISKLLGLVDNSVIANKYAVDNSYTNRIRKNDVLVGILPYSAIADEYAQVTESDVKAAYKDKKDLTYQSAETRDIRFIDVVIVPSRQDKEALKAEVEQSAKELESVNEDYSAFVRLAQSEIPYYDLPYTADGLPADVALRLDSVKMGKVFGPYYNAGDNTYNAFKLLEKVGAYDSIEFRQIQVIGQSKEEIAQRADSIFKALKKGADFEKTAAIYQQAGLSQWISSAVYEGSALAQADVQLLGALNQMKKNEIRNLDLGQGSIILQVTGLKNKVNKYKTVVVKREVEFSNETANKAYDELSAFVATNNTLDALKANARENGYSFIEIPDFTSARHNISGIEKSHEALKWAFQAKEGEISKIYECGAMNEHLLVVAVENIHKKGYRDLKYLRSILISQVSNDKKAEYAINNIFNNVNSLSDLKKIDGIVVDTARFVNFNNATYISGMAENEYLVGAAVANVDRDRFSAPVKGNAGVFVVEKISSDDESGSFDKSMEKDRLKSMASSIISGGLFGELISRAKIEDSRYLYF